MKKKKDPRGKWVGEDEFKEANSIVQDWFENQLRKEGREGIYIDDKGALIYAITLALVKAKEKQQR